METCANCDEPIGKLETPYLWQEQVVCAACHDRLAASLRQRALRAVNIPPPEGDPPPPVSSVASTTVARPTPDVQYIPAAASRPAAACVRCGSAELASAEMVFQQGASIIHGTTLGVVDGDLAYLGSKSTSRTALAQKLAPPVQKNTGCAAVLFAILIVITIAFFAGGSDGTCVGVAIGSLALLCLGIAINCFKWNHDTFPGLYANWKQLWVCRACGYAFSRPLPTAAPLQRSPPIPQQSANPKRMR